jgi:hypothetical protein
VSKGRVIVLLAVSSDTANWYSWSAEVSLMFIAFGRVTVPVNVGEAEFALFPICV